MPRLQQDVPTDPRIRDRAWYETYHPVETFGRALDEHLNALPYGEMIGLRKNQFLLEAWVGLRFALARGDKQLRLGEQGGPDLYVQTQAGGLILLEVTALHNEGRLIAKEYKNWIGVDLEECRIEFDKDSDGQSSEKILRRSESLIARLLEQKAKKRYAPPRHLVCYLNIDGYDEHPNWRSVLTNLSAGFTQFPAIYFLAGQELLRVTPTLRSLKVPLLR